jgi:hypothetical protein
MTLQEFYDTLDTAMESSTGSNTVETYSAAPKDNTSTTPVSELDGAKVRLDSINSIISVCQTIHDSLESASTPVVREWVKKLKSQHPKIDEALTDLSYFQPVSEEIGSRILSKDFDTQDLELEYWGTNAVSIRSITKQKMDSNISAGIESSYQALNTKMVSNLSNEFFEERKVIEEALTSQGRSSVAHDFHLAGDITWVDFVTNIRSSIETTILDFLQDSARLINYLYPINISVTYNNDSIELSVESVNTNINYKGDKVIEPATSIDTSVITPEVENEE